MKSFKLCSECFKPMERKHTSKEPVCEHDKPWTILCFRCLTDEDGRVIMVCKDCLYEEVVQVWGEENV